MTLERTFTLFFLFALAAPAAAQERSPFADLLDLAPPARAAWPELGDLSDGARRIGAAEGEVESAAVKRAWYGHSASFSEAARDRRALGQALQALLGLELAAAKQGRFEAANQYRGAHDSLRAWINLGLERRFASGDAPRTAPRLESPLTRGSGYPELVAELPRQAAVHYGMIPATVGLLTELAREVRRGGKIAGALGQVRVRISFR